MPGSSSVAVFGASGYTGVELLRLLAGHPQMEVVAIGASSAADQTVTDLYPHLDAYEGRSFEDLHPAEVGTGLDAALLALPHEESASVAPVLLEAGARVVDLSGAFRLAAPDYLGWYGFEHPASAWLEKAVYGLPELFGEQIREAALVASPGCYPTPAVLGLAPLLAAGLIGAQGIVIDAKSGISGAGRGATDLTHFAASAGGVRPYQAGGVHRHTPEIERTLARATGVRASVTFVPHLVPAVRGVLTTSYAGTTATAAELHAVLADAYAGEPFVRLLPVGRLPDTKRVTASNMVELGVAVDQRTAVATVVGCVDNLVKGAAGQAIQNLNLMLGFPEVTGLEQQAVYP